MNMHAELRRSQCLQSMRVEPPSSITAGIFEFYYSSCPPVGQIDVSSFYATVFYKLMAGFPTMGGPDTYA